MGFEPREQNTIYESLRDRIKGTIPGLTNFAESTFNWVWTQGFSSEFREKELDKTATYLSGLVDYSGGPLDEDDLRALGIDDVADAEELNERLDDVDLDRLVTIVLGEDPRDDGSPAEGTVTFSTRSADTIIPAGTSVGTQPDAQGDFLEFTTDVEVEAPDGVTTVNADITSVDVGTEYNVGSGTVTYLPNPPTGVQSVTNTTSTTGGEDEESNEELRERAKNAIFETSGGGTVKGVEGFIESEVVTVREVSVEEFFTGDAWHGSYPHAHVIVDGGSEPDVLEAINSSRPVAVEHILVRPDKYNIATSVTLSGSDIDQPLVEGAIERYLNDLGLGDEVVYNKIIQNILNADDDIIDVETLDLSVEDEFNYFNQEELDDFENNDIVILNRNWDGWSGDTANFSAQTGTVIDGTYSGELTSANANVAVTATKASGSSTDHFEGKIQIDNQTTNASDVVSFEFADGATSLGTLEFRGDGNVVFSGAADTTITTWTASSTDEVTLQFDFANDQVDVTVNGSTSNDLGLTNSVSSWTNMSLRNNTTASTGTVNAYVDQLYIMHTTYPLGLGDEMVADGITDVTGRLNGAAHTFVEDTDYRETTVGSSEDAIEWILSGDNPDIQTGQTTTFTYDSNVDEYRIDEAMVDEGIVKVEDGTGNTFIEGTDWEEKDLSNDNRDDSLVWLSGGSTPANGATVTVTYTSSTDATVDYDIADSDTTIDENEKANAGTVTISVL